MKNIATIYNVNTNCNLLHALKKNELFELYLKEKSNVVPLKIDKGQQNG